MRNEGTKAEAIEKRKREWLGYFGVNSRIAMA
jgi:hypothetical protein